jgi:hypothetical protein
MAEEIWTLEVFEFSLGEGVAKIIDGPTPVAGTLDAAKEIARKRMATFVENDQPGYAVRLLDGAGIERYQWTRHDDALVRGRMKEIEDRRPGKNNA